MTLGSVCGSLFLSALPFVLDNLINSSEFTHHGESPKAIFSSPAIAFKIHTHIPQAFGIYTFLAPGYLKILMARLTVLTYLLHIHTHQAVETTAKATICHFSHIRINDTYQGTKDKKNFLINRINI